jgi:hypothetical protein
MTQREQLYPEIKRLREAEGLMWREIGERLGISLKTACEYYHDPTGAKTAARKARNNGTCIDCGAETRDGGSKIAPDRCRDCAKEHQKTLEYRLAHKGGNKRTWTDDALLDALRSAAIRGRLTVAMYEAALANAPDGAMPSRSTILNRFGTWARAHDAAGLLSRHHNTSHGITREGCLLAVMDCAADLGRIPTLRDYEKWARDGRGPSGTLVRVRFGSWRAVMDECIAQRVPEAA